MLAAVRRGRTPARCGLFCVRKEWCPVRHVWMLLWFEGMEGARFVRSIELDGRVLLPDVPLNRQGLSNGCFLVFRGGRNGGCHQEGFVRTLCSPDIRVSVFLRT